MLLLVSCRTAPPPDTTQAKALTSLYFASGDGLEAAMLLLLLLPEELKKRGLCCCCGGVGYSCLLLC